MDDEDEVRILIADAHRGARRALRALLEHQPGMHVAGVADSASDALQAASELAPDVVLLDRPLLDADPALVDRLERLLQPPAVLLLVAPPDVPDERTARQLGVAGAIGKTAGRDAVLAAIRRALAAPAPPVPTGASPANSDEFPSPGETAGGDDFPYAESGIGIGSPLTRGFSLSLGGGTHDLTTHTAEARTWRFREALSRWATGVAIVTCREGDTLEGITVSSLCSLSLEPPLVLIAIGEGQRILPALLRGHFTINILGAQQQPLAEHFAGQGHAALEPEMLEDDVLAGSRAALICSLWAEHPGGDHRIIAGRVERVWLGSPDDPLLYFARDYRAIGPIVPAE